MKKALKYIHRPLQKQIIARLGGSIILIALAVAMESASQETSIPDPEHVAVYEFAAIASTDLSTWQARRGTTALAISLLEKSTPLKITSLIGCRSALSDLVTFVLFPYPQSPSSIFYTL